MDINAFAQNSAINIGEGFAISVQAGSGLYCEPRITTKDLYEYSQFEILITFHDKNVIMLNDSMKLSDYEIYVDNEELFETLSNGVYIVNEGCPIAGYVDGEKIDAIIQDLKFVVIKMRSRNVLFEKIGQKCKFFKII